METQPNDDRFRDVFLATFPMAERVALRLTGDRAVAQELAAEALTRLYASWWRLAGAGHHEAWVLRVTTNLAIGVMRRKKTPTERRRPPAMPLADEVVQRVALTNALHQLPRRQRQVVVLRYLSDLSEADVAEMLGLSRGSVKTHLHRALASLQEALDTRDETALEVRLVAP